MDPDYEPIASLSITEESRQCELQEKNDSLKRITNVIEAEFKTEIDNLESDIYEIDERLNESRLVLDRLRAAMLISYYEKSANKSDRQQNLGIHPAIKREIGKSVIGSSTTSTSTSTSTSSASSSTTSNNNTNNDGNTSNTGTATTKGLSIDGITLQKVCNSEVKGTSGTTKSLSDSNYITKQDSYPNTGQLKHRVIVGNVSKYLPIETRQKNDQSTHKWMVYVRGPREKPDLSPIVKKVWFFLHPTYRPNDLVEISEPPFHLTRRGWGEFPVRVKLLLNDARNRKIDIIHHLKLDRTYTGLQNLGAETHVDIELDPGVPEPNLEDQSYLLTDASSNSTVDQSSTAINSTNTNTASTDTNTASTNTNTASTDTNTASTDIKEPSTRSQSEQDENVLHDRLQTQQKFKVIRPAYEDDSDTIAINGEPLLKKFRPSMKKKPLVEPLQLKLVQNSSNINCVNNGVPMKSLLKINQIHNGNEHSGNTNPQKNIDNKNKFVMRVPHNATTKLVTARPVYVKCKLPDGRIMLINKDVYDKLHRPKDGVSTVKTSVLHTPTLVTSTNTRSTSKINLPSTNAIKLKGHHDRNQILTPTNRTESQILQHTACLNSSEGVYKLPELKYITDIHSLLSHLARAHPLTSQTVSSPLLPSYTTYIKWPAGKRHALEWQRAKAICRHLASLSESEDCNILKTHKWSTKSIAIWCRAHLFTPQCPDDNEAMFSSQSQLKCSNKRVFVEDLLNDSSQSVDFSRENRDSIIDVLTDVRSNHTHRDFKEELFKPATGVQTREEYYIMDLVHQLGVKLEPNKSSELSTPGTASLLYKLYMKFMEDLLRESYAAKRAKPTANEDFDELKVHHVVDGIKSCDQFIFLNDLFVDVETSNS